jgi:hypothetical protein
MRGRQLTLVSHGVLPPSVADLEGVLLGPGQLARMGGTARLSVVVGQRWRQAALLAAFVERGLSGEAASTEDGQPTVRTPFLTALGPAARCWTRGAVKAVPENFVLDGQRLRLWAIAAGQTDGSGYVLTLGAHDDPNVWSSAGAALARAGLPGTFLQHSTRHAPVTTKATKAAKAAAVPPDPATPPAGRASVATTGAADIGEEAGTNTPTSGDRAAGAGTEAGHGRGTDGPAYRVTGRRRLARLAELVGEPPPGAESADWPT